LNKRIERHFKKDQFPAIHAWSAGV
jgi:hypothetical protein